MRRTWPMIFLALGAGCRFAAEHEPLRPLPEAGALFTYQEMVTRARAQAGAALEAFYQDAWSDMEDTAKGLQQTARILPRTIEQPAHVKDALAQISSDLGLEAAKLGDAARAKSIPATTEAMQRITVAIRALRPKDGSAKDKVEKE